MKTWARIPVRSVCVLLITVIFLSGCYATTASLKPPLEDEGEVFLYVQPFSGEMERLRFSLSEVAALRDDGTAFPLSLAISDFNVSVMSRQRLVASGALPPGSYVGLSFLAANALFKSAEGENDLVMPEKPLLSGFPFEVRRGKASVITGVFRFAESVQDRIGFNPSFSLFPPEPPITALTGYVVNYRSNNITVFNKKSGQVSGVIATGMGPRGMALDKVRQKAYIALAGDDAVDVLDIASGNIEHRILLTTGDRPQEPALTPDGHLLVTANKGSDTVSILDTASFIELDKITVGKGPNSVLIEPAGRKAYVFNTLSDTISIIDLANRSVIATIAADAGPLRGQLNLNGDRLSVIHGHSSYLTVIDPQTLSVLQRISVGMGASALKIDTRTDRLFLGNRMDSLVSVYERALELPTDTIQATGGVACIAIDNDENNLYLVIPRKKALMSINIVSNRTVAEFDVGDGAYWVTLMGER